jgi:hypothetical protein
MRNVVLFTLIVAALLSTACVCIEEPDMTPIKQIQAVNDAEVRFQSRFGRFGSLQELGPAGADLVSADLASGRIPGYEIRIETFPRQYRVSAHPDIANRQHHWVFTSDQSRRIERREVNESDHPAIPPN